MHLVVALPLATTTAEFIVSVVVAGVLGPAVAFIAGRSADRRRFTHERGLKASDDLVEHIDEVAASFEALREACARLRLLCAAAGPEDPFVLQHLQEAEAAYIRTRALVSRLAIRPHADQELVDRAMAGASKMYRAIENVSNASLARQEVANAVGRTPVIGEFDDKYFEANMNDAEKDVEVFEDEARAAIARLLSSL